MHMNFKIGQSVVYLITFIMKIFLLHTYIVLFEIRLCTKRFLFDIKCCFFKLWLAGSTVYDFFAVNEAPVCVFF